MSEFALTFLQSKEDEEASLLLRRIYEGSDTEAREALSELFERAKSSNNPDDWNAAALGFNYAGISDEATNIFKYLVETYPDNDIYHLNLAVSYSQIEQIELCRQHLRYVAENGSSEEFRRLGLEQLEGYERFVGLTKEDEKLRALQINGLRRIIGTNEQTPDDYIKLGRLLISRSRIDLKGNWLSEAALVLEQGREAFPQEPEILEHLIAIYLRQDPNGRLSETLARLEKIAPNSHVLGLLTTIDEEEAAAFSENIYQRANVLMRQVVESKESHIRESALQDLAKIVAMYPQNTGYRLLYAFALMGVGKKEAALEEANLLSETPDDSYNFHFNLGQIFWICGNPAQGQSHLDLAVSYAENEQDRQEALDRILDLKSRKL